MFASSARILKESHTSWEIPEIEVVTIGHRVCGMDLTLRVFLVFAVKVISAQFAFWRLEAGLYWKIVRHIPSV
jgi:hypothetical protein